MVDVRGGSGGRVGGGGVRAGGGVGIVGVIIFLAIQLLGGGSTFEVPAGLDGGGPAAQGEPIPASQDPDRDLRNFSSYVFTDVQDTWTKTFEAAGKSYRRAKLVLYSGTTGTGCGTGSAAQGPFYCPADQRVYLDLSFYRDMERRLRAGGDFAWAYVIGHELGHHVQNLLGQSDKVQELTRDNPGRRQRAVRPAGAAGRLLRGRMGALGVRPARAGRRRGGDDRLAGGRR